MSKVRSAALERAKSIIGDKDFGRALSFYKNLNGRKRMSDADFNQLVEDWKLMSGLWESDVIGDLNQMVADIVRIHNLADVDTTNWTDEEKYAFVKEYREQFGISVFTERLHKEQGSILKASLDDLAFNADGSITFDSSKAALFTPETVDIKAKYGKPEMRWVDTAEDGISRMLAEQGRSIVVFFLGQTDDDPEKMKALREQKYNLFSRGCIDVATGKHYFFSFQNPSSTRKANFMFVQANDFNEVKSLWLTITGFPTWDSFMHSNLFDKEGKCVYAKLLARVSTRGSNSFSLDKLAKTEELESILDEITSANIAYTGDTTWVIDRDFKTMVAPGTMEMKSGKQNKRKIKPGDGQMVGSFKFHARIAALMRIIKLDDYYEFLQLWSDAGENFANVKEGSRLWTLIQKIPEVFQLRHGEKKGISVRYNLEAIPELAQYDAIVPDSVRKFVGGEWSAYPLEICNWLKKREGWVAMNPQFLESLALGPYELQPIAEYWLSKMEKALVNTMDAMEFLKMVSSSMDTEAASIDDNNVWSAGIVQQALWANASLIHEKQIRNWMSAQFEKMVNDMRIGRILVPGMYSYMVCDPGFIVNRLFFDADNQKMRDSRGLPTISQRVHELKENEYYYNGYDNLEVAMFRSPLIHPFEAQKVVVINDTHYAYMQGVMVFNGYDGRWDRMGGGDFDGDQAAFVPKISELAQIIVNGVREYDYDIYEDGLHAQEHTFTDDGLFNYLADNAKRDRTGILTNHASRCLDLSNSLVSLITIAHSMCINRIRFIHPKAFGESNYGFYGSDYTYGTIVDNGVPILTARGYVEYTKTGWSENGLVGEYTLDQVQYLADYYLGLVEILRLLQGREIDGAKTGVYAEGVSGQDYIEAVKVPFTPHCMLTRQEILGKPISEKAKKNKFHSFSPLGFLCDYVTTQTADVEEGGCGRILSQLKNGTNMALQMYCCLTPEEQEFFNVSWACTDGKYRTLVDFMSERKATYGKKLYDMNQGNLNKEESSELLKAIKENERAELEQLASALGCPMTVMAVAAYSVAYSRNNRQNSGLTYGWILPASNLEVFSRANKAFRLIRLHKSEINFVKVENGELYVDGERMMKVDAYDGYAPIRIIDGCPCAMLHKKTSVATQPIAVDSSTVYTIGTTGLKHHIGKLINNFDNDYMVASWKATIQQNNFQFDITEDQTGQIVISINGYSLSTLMLNNAHVEQLAPLLNKRVMLVNDKCGPIEQQIQWKSGTATLNNLRVVIVGDAQ